MGSQYAFDEISEGDFDDILSQYDEIVPSKLAQLEEERLVTIPASLAARKKDGRAYLLKSEVATLVDWKLSHGKFRPSLKGLVQQNSDEFVEETTEAGFSAEPWSSSLDTLTKLKGIGPATAALLLSTYDPEKLPFFSDELFRWAFWEDKTGARWNRKIKYSLKEYRELVARVDELRKRLGKGALEAEKVAYVLGKRETPLGKQSSAVQTEDSTKPVEEHDTALKPVASANKSARGKRKVPESESPDKALPGQSTKKAKATTTSTSQRATRSSNRKKGKAT